MFEQLGVIRRRFGIAAAVVAGLLAVVWAALSAISNLDTLRALANQEHPHWLVRMITGIPSPTPWITIALAAVGVLLVAWAIYLLRHPPSPPPTATGGARPPALPSPGPVGISVDESSKVKIAKNKMRGFGTGVRVTRSEDVEIEENESDKEKPAP
jgi:hypothetical protein